ncbi:YfhE family protein [Aquibacillus halophilus]|uniref:YfhE family protein n=1 Tax=Aquibacillus halophilus TaxID=930132 RepID=A0A6A8DTV4_9BACI|nr:YfhE family protein [Aquibacillus halophilus]MRH44652.1 YfhE family protein [Aquibacillus halophilus]
MKKKAKGIKEARSSLSKTQEVLYQKEFRAADRMYQSTKNKM